MGKDDGIMVEVVYAEAEIQALERLKVPAGTTVGEALRRSGLRSKFPGIDTERNGVGIFGRRVGLDTVLRAGDRVEIYRPLVADPKRARRDRARRKHQP